MSGFGKLRENLEKLAKIPDLVTNAAATEIKALVQDEFNQGRDPYGRQWAPLKRGGASYLYSSGATRGSFDLKISGTDIELFVDWRIIFHAAGTEHMPARPLFSVGVMPPSWSNAIERAFSNAMENR